MKKFYAVLVLAIINIGYALGMYIDSWVIETSDWGTSFDCNFDYFIWFISGIIILIIAIFIYQEQKVKNNKD